MAGMTVWQIKGTNSIINCPAGTMAGQATFTFQKMPKGGAWGNMFSVTQTSSVVNKTISFDTGFQNFTPAPAKGDQYRVHVTGYYILGGPPAQTVNMAATDSGTVTPVP